ncbi:G protein pathway suppressor 2-like isoform X2 [Ptychodera flava]|uniref:G protein pathway suppressor 2-like isoform X2 n=1 Tax=Ptychodera flava TaxID=63121 RepID=UPI00396A0DA8
MPALLERPKMTQAMAAALKHHILKERERKRQEEEEADKAIERKKEERERQRKKAEAESLNLEETREEIKKLEEKLKELQHEKHELFLQLKKVLNEDENRRRQKIKEQSEREFIHPMSHTQYHGGLAMAGPPMMVPGHITAGRPALLGDSPKGHMYRPQTPPSQAVHPGVKRPRSPSPPVVQLYPQRPNTQGAYTQNQHHSSYATHQTAHSSYHGTQHHNQATSYQQGHSSYSGNKSSNNYPNQSHVSYPSAQQQPTHGNYTASQSGNSKYTGNQSAFSSYPGHYVPQQAQMNAQNYQLQQQQQRYIQTGQHGQHSSNMSMQQQLEHANQQSGFTEEQGHYKMQQQQASQQPQAQPQAQQQHIRPIAQGHHGSIHPQQSHQTMLSQPLQAQMHLQPGNKPSIVTGYSARQTRPSSPMYHPKQQPQPQHQQQQSQPQQHSAGYQSPRHGHPGAYLPQQSRW